MNTAEMAKYLKVHPTTLHMFVKNGILAKPEKQSSNGSGLKNFWKEQDAVDAKNERTRRENKKGYGFKREDHEISEKSNDLLKKVFG